MKLRNVLFQFPTYKATVAKYITGEKDIFLEKLGDEGEIVHAWIEGVFTCVVVVKTPKLVG